MPTHIRYELSFPWLQLEYRKRMRLSVEYIFAERNGVVFEEQEVQVFEPTMSA